MKGIFPKRVNLKEFTRFDYFFVRALREGFNSENV